MSTETQSSRELENIREDIAVLKEDLRALTRALGQEGRDRLDQAADQAGKKAGEIIEGMSLGELKRRLAGLEEEGGEVAELARRLVDRYPAGTLLAVLGLGILLGRMMRD